MTGRWTSVTVYAESAWSCATWRPGRGRDCGDHRDAAEIAHRRIQLEPLEEVGYRLLMETQAESGDRGAAMGTYHRCASMLEQELGVSPESTDHPCP